MGTSDLVYFKSGGGSGSSSGDYVKDAFKDLTLNATNNTGFSSTVLKNPLNEYFGDDDFPRYSVKTLWVKDLVLIEDRAFWIDNKPTYKIIWNEDYPAAHGYVVGNAALRSSGNGKTLDVRNVDDIFGVTGVIRRVMFICTPTPTAAGTADIVVDGSDTGTDASFGNAASDSSSDGYNKFNALIHSATNEDQNIHDYRLVANETQTLSLAGVVVFHLNATSNIDAFPGSTYVDKEKQTTSAITVLGVTTIPSQLGANTVIYKTNADTYAQTVQATPVQVTAAIGLSGTNQIQVTTGQGASFLVGDGIISGAGATFYYGVIASISTDTFTVGPTLAFGVSNTLYRAWSASATYIVGSTLWGDKINIDPRMLQVYGNAMGFGQTTTGNFYWQSNTENVRVWGRNISLQQIDVTPGIAFSTTLGFLQVDGYFSAAEITFMGAGSIHGTFGVNGLAAFNVNQAFTGLQKYTVFTNAGPGWNSFVFSVGASFNNSTIANIALYRRQYSGQTLGQLAKYDDLVTNAHRPALNATLFEQGTYRRVFADSLYLSGSWGRGETFTAAGGVLYFGGSTNSAINFQWYGKNVALIGTAASGGTLIIDGVGTVATFNSMLTVASEGFHSLLYTVTTGTAVIQAIDYTRTKGEFKSLQERYPLDSFTALPQIYVQSYTPTLKTNGTQWIRNKFTGEMWTWFVDRWYQISTGSQSEDPNQPDQYAIGGGNV